MKIAVIDNDSEQAELVCQVLASIGHTCQPASNGMDWLDQTGHEEVHMLILDWQSAGRTAADLIREMRARLPWLPILLLAGRADEDGVVAALAAGVSDYLVKPLRRGELAMRVQALLKRAYPDRQSDATIHFDNFAFETGTGRLTVDGVPVELTQKEFALALLFFRNLGRPLSRAYIQENVWSRDADIPSRTLDTHVSRVRNKLGLRPEKGFRLAPVYSFGYRLEQLAG